MKSTLLTVSVLLACVCVSYAQMTDSTKFKEVGLNATPFINQYLDFGSGNGEFLSPYMLTYEQKMGRFGARLGIGLLASNTLDKPEDEDVTLPEFHENDVNFDSRLGLVAYKNLPGRWTMKYGVDGTFSMDKNKNWTNIKNLFGDDVESTNSEIMWQTGISPFVFIQFHVTEHFSLGTELLGTAAYSQTVTKVENTEFPDFNTRQESNRKDFNISPPTALFFIFRF